VSEEWLSNDGVRHVFGMRSFMI